jgi:DNA gyrase subunit A
VRLYNLRTLLREWINHRVAVITLRSQNRLLKIDERLHRLRGFLAVFLDIDRAVAIVRGSKTRAIARPALMKAFEIDDDQANAVLDLNLGQLTEDAIIEFRKETTELDKEHARLTKLLASPSALRKQVGVELEGIADQFNHVERVTEITTVETPKPTKTSFVLEEPVTITITGDGYLQSFKASSKAKPRSVVVRQFDTMTTMNLVAVTAAGRLYRALAASIPGDKPTAAVNVLPGLEPNDHIVGWWLDDTVPADLLLVTSDGSIKRIAGEDLVGGDRRGGIVIIKLDAGATVVAAVDVTGEAAAGPSSDELFSDAPPVGPPILIVTRNGQSIRFALDIRFMGRAAAGVRGIKLGAKDQVVGALVAHDDTDLVIVHTSGNAKRLTADLLPQQRRGGVGVRCTVVTGKHGLVGVIGVAGDTMARVGNEWQEISLGLGVATGARDAAPAKIRGFEGIITEVL